MRQRSIEVLRSIMVAKDLGTKLDGCGEETEENVFKIWFLEG